MDDEMLYFIAFLFFIATVTITILCFFSCCYMVFNWYQKQRPAAASRVTYVRRRTVSARAPSSPIPSAPEYEWTAPPPSYEDVVSIHYSDNQVQQPAQPRTTALAPAAHRNSHTRYNHTRN